MDKVREILTMLKKHHFWIFSVVVSAAILGCWYQAKGSLSQMYATEKSSIESARNGLDAIKNNPFHPNPAYKTGVEKERDEIKLTTDKEWQKLYERQRSVFTWPTELPDFAAWEESGRTKPMTRLMRQQYQVFIDDEFPRLEQLVNVRREKYPQGTGASTSPAPPRSAYPGAAAAAYGGGAQTAEMIGIVDWDPSDFIKLKDGLKTWGTKEPVEIEVLMCHESLAVYRSLLEAIAKCNANATDNDNAIVKRIQALDIGRDASNPGPFDSMSNIIMPGDLLAAAEGTINGAAMYASMGRVPVEGEVISKESILLENRYLDGSGKPVPAEAAQASPPFAEFQLMKVRLCLVVDQRGIPKILANLANAKLGVEVHQVRINPQNVDVVTNVRNNLGGGGGGGGGPSYGGRPGGGYPGGAVRSPGRPEGGGSPYGGRPGGSPYGGRPGGREGGAPAGYGGGGMTGQTPGENANDATIEIKGIMYIYSRFNPAKTGSGTDTSEPSASSVFGMQAAAGATTVGAPVAE